MMPTVEVAFRAVRPWNSVDACGPTRISTDFDSQARINKCLSCTLPDCTNCFEQKERVMRGQISLFGG